MWGRKPKPERRQIVYRPEVIEAWHRQTEAIYNLRKERKSKGNPEHHRNVGRSSTGLPLVPVHRRVHVRHRRVVLSQASRSRARSRCLRGRGAGIAALFAASMTVGGVLVSGGVASAKITPPSCVNNGENLPKGQQPTCHGGGLNQNPASNPAGQRASGFAPVPQS
jgi:hypothetical protein